MQDFTITGNATRPGDGPRRLRASPCAYTGATPKEKTCSRGTGTGFIAGGVEVGATLHCAGERCPELSNGSVTGNTQWSFRTAALPHAAFDDRVIRRLLLTSISGEGA